MLGLIVKICVVLVYIVSCGYDAKTLENVPEWTFYPSVLESVKLPTDHCPPQKRVGWTSLAQTRDFHMFLVMEKDLNGKLPIDISSFLAQPNDTDNTCTSNWLLLNSLYSGRCTYLLFISAN